MVRKCKKVNCTTHARFNISTEKMVYFVVNVKLMI